MARGVRHLAPGLAGERSSASMHASRNAEYQKFVPAFVSLLREAMQLRGRGLEDGDYYDETERNVRTRRPTDGHRTEGLRRITE